MPNLLVEGASRETVARLLRVLSDCLEHDEPFEVVYAALNVREESLGCVIGWNACEVRLTRRIGDVPPAGPSVPGDDA